MVLVNRFKRNNYLFNTAEDISDIIPDPLFEKQWFLNHGAVDGSDMNVIPAWQKGYTGKNVVVTILDDGIQINHPDLAQNYDPMASTGHFLSDNLTLNCTLKILMCGKFKFLCQLKQFRMIQISLVVKFKL